jgi:lipid-binding SYLF domain-containing protein
MSDPVNNLKREIMTIRKSYVAAAFGLAAVLASTVSFGATKAQIDAGVSATLTQFQALNPNHQQLESKAAGMLVFPRVTKGGAGVAGEFGEGVLQVKGQTMGYYKLSSGSVGLTLGVARHREIIMFMTQDSLDKFINSKGWAVGADTSVAVMKVGAGGDYDTTTLAKPILGFVFGEKGLMGDVSLEGTKVSKIVK